MDWSMTQEAELQLYAQSSEFKNKTKQINKKNHLLENYPGNM
jgi:hypothetical protein